MLASEFDDGFDSVQFADEETEETHSPVKKNNTGKRAEAKQPHDYSKRQRTEDDGNNKKYRASLFRKNPVASTAVNDKKVITVSEPLFCSKTFQDIAELHPHMVANLGQTLGITQVTEIQSKTIPVIQANKDALVRSQTGSGKTLAYAIPIVEALHKIRPKLTRKDGLHAVVILPTRELALQTYECFIKLIKPYTWLVPGLLIGGEKRKSEKARLRKGITILISTPGRLLDHARKTQCISFKTVRWLIIDEADRLLDLGYEKDITSIIEILDEQCESQRQTVLLSATLSSAVERLAGLSLNNPVRVDTVKDTSVLENALIIPDTLKQNYVAVAPKLKLVTLSALLVDKCLVQEEKCKVLVFVATQAMVDFYTELFSTVFTDINFYKLHGSMSQTERFDVFRSFRTSSNGVLLCSDVAARGLDLPQVDWIVQYTAPVTTSDYVHRVGRTARVGHKGYSVLFLSPYELAFINKLQDRSICITEVNVEKCMKVLLDPNFNQSEIKDVEFAAVALQKRFETAVCDQKRLHQLGCKAYLSWTRFYSTYPKEVRDAFDYRKLHLGHYAKSFALQDAPKTISSIGKQNSRDEPPQKRDFNFSNPRRNRTGGKSYSKSSEFDSGFKPKKKKLEN